MSGNIYKAIVVPAAIIIYVIVGAIYREKRGHELTQAEKNNIFNKSYAAIIIAIIIIFAVLFYVMYPRQSRGLEL